MDAEEPRAFPGRSQTSRGWTEIWIRGKGEDWTGIVPRGTRCRIDRTNLFRAEPETFVAPAEVRVTPAPKYQIHLRAEVRPNGRRIDGPTRLTLRFHHAAPGLRGRARHVCDVSVLMGGGDRATICEQDMLLDDASGALQWSGAGVLAGAVELRDLPDATTGATRTPIDARIDLDPRPSGDVPETREQETEYSFRASGAGDTDDDIECHLLGADGDVDTTTIPRGEVLTMTRLGLRCAFASCGPLVSETVALTATPAGPHLFELAPGGFLVVVPANLPPRTLGAAFLERDDGRPFLWDGGRDVGTRRTLEAGAVLGPLLPGPVTFRVTLQGRVLATATATVRAGTYETLKLPRLRAQ
jgi:hypothetical protein